MLTLYYTMCEPVKYQSTNGRIPYLVSGKMAIVDGVGALNCATNPSYPNTEPRMSRIKTNRYTLSPKNSIDPNHSLRRLTPSCNWDYSCGSLWRPIQLPIQD